MVPAAHRQMVVSAAFALASWALVVGAPALAAPPAERAGPQLPPAEYKPLPKGTKVEYGTWWYTVEDSDGFDVTFKVRSGRWGHYYAVFGKHGEQMYSRQTGVGEPWETTLDDEGKSTLEGLWPLEVGKKVEWNLEEAADPVYAGGFRLRRWTVTVEVVGTEVLELNGILYPTYVVKEHAVGEGAIYWYESGDPKEYTETKWYNPESGLVLKSVKEWIDGTNKGEQKEYSLSRVRFPKGTKTHVLAGTKVTSEADARLVAEIARLRRELGGQPEMAAREAPQPPPAAPQAGPVEFRGIEFGRYHALVIGIGNYKHLPRLKTAVKDAKAVADVLRQDYGFAVKLLLDPARDDIVDTLDEYRAALGKGDNLLVYYAGHGWLDEESNRGYWLAADARPNRRSKWVSNATITDTLKTLQAKHVMVVADSCYSGTLIRGALVGLRGGDYWRRMAKKRARVALTSGGLEPVMDSGGGDHSPFARAFIAALKKNDAVMDGTTLFNEVRRPVMVSANQTPEYSDVRNAGHDGGDFLFVRRR